MEFITCSLDLISGGLFKERLQPKAGPAVPGCDREKACCRVDPCISILAGHVCAERLVQLACGILALLHDGSPAVHVSHVCLCLLQGWQRAWAPSWSPWWRSRSSLRSCSSAVRCAARLGCLEYVIQAKSVPGPACWAWELVVRVEPVAAWGRSLPLPRQWPCAQPRRCVAASWALDAGHVISSGV